MLKIANYQRNETQNYNEISSHTSQNGYHQKGYKQQTANAGVVVEKGETSYAASENVNWYSHYGEQYGSFLKKLKIELPYYAGIPLLAIYLKKTLI